MVFDIFSNNGDKIFDLWTSNHAIKCTRKCSAVDTTHICTKLLITRILICNQGESICFSLFSLRRPTHDYLQAIQWQLKLLTYTNGSVSFSLGTFGKTERGNKTKSTASVLALRFFSLRNKVNRFLPFCLLSCNDCLMWKQCLSSGVELENKGEREWVEWKHNTKSYRAWSHNPCPSMVNLNLNLFLRRPFLSLSISPNSLFTVWN